MSQLGEKWSTYNITGKMSDTVIDDVLVEPFSFRLHFELRTDVKCLL